MKKEQLEQLNKLLKEMENIFSRDEDVHRHTRRLGEICRQFIAFDNQYIKSLEKAQNINSVIQEILARCPINLKANVGVALNSIKNSQGADGETGLPLRELLIRTWSLNNSYANGEDLIFDNLNHNKIAGGGCLPGIAARLVQPYTAFLYRRLEALSHGYKTESLSSNKGNEYFEDDEQLARALSASMHLSHKNTTVNAPEKHLEEDEDLLLAKALSLSLSDSLQEDGTNNTKPLLFSRAEEDELQLAIRLSAQAAQKEEDEECAVKLHISLNSLRF